MTTLTPGFHNHDLSELSEELRIIRARKSFYLNLQDMKYVEVEEMRLNTRVREAQAKLEEFLSKVERAPFEYDKLCEKEKAIQDEIDEREERKAREAYEKLKAKRQSKAPSTTSKEEKLKTVIAEARKKPQFASMSDEELTTLFGALI